MECEARVRSYGEACTLTVKQGSGRTRLEDEITISRELFESLWAATEGRRIEKIRYRIQWGECLIELDCYCGGLDGLVVAEVEFSSEEAASSWVPPSWFGREVTDDKAYKNQRLALSKPRP